jgi:hypothetical protein
MTDCRSNCAACPTSARSALAKNWNSSRDFCACSCQHAGLHGHFGTYRKPGGAHGPSLEDHRPPGDHALGGGGGWPARVRAAGQDDGGIRHIDSAILPRGWTPGTTSSPSSTRTGWRCWSRRERRRPFEPLRQIRRSLALSNSAPLRRGGLTGREAHVSVPHRARGAVEATITRAGTLSPWRL